MVGGEKVQSVLWPVACFFGFKVFAGVAVLHVACDHGLTPEMAKIAYYCLR